MLKRLSLPAKLARELAGTLAYLHLLRIECFAKLEWRSASIMNGVEMEP
jgi:hypothetical protein